VGRYADGRGWLLIDPDIVELSKEEEEEEDLSSRSYLLFLSVLCHLTFWVADLVFISTCTLIVDY
jgi:hypothetical protein